MGVNPVAPNLKISARFWLVSTFTSKYLTVLNSQIRLALKQTGHQDTVYTAPICCCDSIKVSLHSINLDQDYFWESSSWFCFTVSQSAVSPHWAFISSMRKISNCFSKNMDFLKVAALHYKELSRSDTAE